MRGLLRLGTLAWPLAAALSTGCAEELGPERWQTTRVTGVVTEGKKPVGRGWIEFLPADGTVGTMRSAPLGPDGRFEAVGVAVGTNRIGVAGAPIGNREFRRLFDPLGSPIRRTITKATAVDGLKIDLLDEYALWSSTRPADP